MLENLFPMKSCVCSQFRLNQIIKLEFVQLRFQIKLECLFFLIRNQTIGSFDESERGQEN